MQMREVMRTPEPACESPVATEAEKALQHSARKQCERPLVRPARGSQTFAELVHGDALIVTNIDRMRAMQACKPNRLLCMVQNVNQKAPLFRVGLPVPPRPYLLWAIRPSEPHQAPLGQQQHSPLCQRP
jgi:hypothetical protein